MFLVVIPLFFRPPLFFRFLLLFLIYFVCLFGFLVVFVCLFVVGFFCFSVPVTDPRCQIAAAAAVCMADPSGCSWVSTPGLILAVS